MKKAFSKKVISILLSLVVVLAALPLTALPAFAETLSAHLVDTNIDWTLNTETGELVLSGSGYWQIGTVFQNDPRIRSIVIGNGIKMIAVDAFRGCKNLTSVSIGSDLITIRESAFENCSSLVNINLPNSLEQILDYAFKGTAITNLVIPKNVWKIEQSALRNMPELEYLSVANDNRMFDSRDYCNAIIRTDTNTLVIGCKNTVIPTSVTAIGGGAFAGCADLTAITLPYGSLETIGANAFQGTGLTSIVIPGSVTSIDNTAFSGCDLSSIVVSGGNPVYDSRNSCKAIIETATNTLILGCKNTVIPDTVTAIGDSAFYDCDGLTSFTVPNSVTTIGKSAFFNCDGLTSITLPDSITTIGEAAFKECAGLTSVNLSDEVATIGESAFKNCTGLTSITIPNSVTTIETDAFYRCTGLTSVTVPGNVTSIQTESFYGCTGLTSVTLSEGITDIGNRAFKYCTGLTSVTIPDSVTILGEGVFSDSGLTSAALGNGITTVPSFLFYDCYYLKNVCIPASVTEIEYYAFTNCSGLTDVYYAGPEDLWNNVTIDYSDVSNRCLHEATKHYIAGACGDHAFYEYKLATNELVIEGEGATHDFNTTNPGYYLYRSAVSTITVKEGITRIGAYTFYELQNATAVSLPASLAQVSPNAFRDCNSLSDVYYLGSQDDWNDIIIGANNQALTNATLHISETGACGDNATYCYNAEIGALTIRGTGDMYDYENDYAPWHNYRASITSVTVEEGITSIGDYAFGDTNITEFTIPASVTEVGARALQNCRGLTEIDIHEGITAIGEAAFDGCRGLTRVIIPEGVTTVSYAAFYNCTGLTEVTLPFSVAAIGDYAFDGCSSLADIYYPGTKRDWYGMDVGNNESILNGTVRHFEMYNLSGEIEDTDLEWKYNPVTCVLTIGGEGELPEEFAKPWYGYRQEIKKIVIGDGVTKISAYLFNAHHNLEAVCLGSGVTSIGESAFFGCTKLTDVYYNGDQYDDWPEIAIGINNDRLTNATRHYGDRGYCNNTSGVKYHFDPCTATLTINGTGAMPDNYSLWGRLASSAVRNEIKTVIVENGVTRIGEEAFRYNPNIEIVVIGPDVTSIGANAFLDCNKIAHVFYDGSQADWNSISIDAGNNCLTNATIHFAETGVCGDNAKYALNLFTDKLTITGTGDMYDYSANSPFDSDLRIGSVLIGDGITRVGGWAFNGCANITSVKMPSTLTSVGEYAFRTCAGLKGVIIPDSVTAIENGAFTQCAGMKTLALSENLTTLGNYAFSSCEKLKVVRVPASITSFGSEVFSGCTGLTGVRFLDGLTSIGIRAFEGCTSLTELTIPDSVQTIMNYAFTGCTALEFATIGSGLGSQLTRVYTGAFNMCTALTSVLYFGTSADWYNITINNANLPLKDAVKECCLDGTLTARCGANVNWLLDVATGALTIRGTGDMFDYENGAHPSFNQYEGMIKTAAVESGVTNVGSFAFCFCNELTSATLANTVTAIGNGAFEHCSKLETVNIPAGVTTIGSYAFSNCYELNGVSIPSSVTSIGQGAFNDCQALTQIAIPDGITAINLATFAFCYALTSVTIPASVTVIDDGAFYGSNSLATVNYPGSDDDWCAVTIGVYNDPLLKVKPQIKTGSCGDSLTYSYNKETGTLTISGTGAMRNYTYDGANDAPFKDLPGLVKIEIGDGVTSVGTFAFADCATVTDIAFPKSADDLGNGFLYGCGALERLYCYGGYVCDSYFRTHGYTAELRLYGDTHVDTVFDALDYSAAVNASLNAANLSYEQKTIADYNRDGVVDALDCRLVKLLSQGKSLPA